MFNQRLSTETIGFLTFRALTKCQAETFSGRWKCNTQVALCHGKRDFYEQNGPMRLESWRYPSNASMGTEKCVAPVFDSALEEQTLKNTWWLFIYLKKNSKKCWKEITVYILLWLIFILPSCSFLVCHVHSMLVNCSFSFEF